MIRRDTKRYADAFMAAAKATLTKSQYAAVEAAADSILEKKRVERARALSRQTRDHHKAWLASPGVAERHALVDKSKALKKIYMRKSTTDQERDALGAQIATLATEAHALLPDGDWQKGIVFAYSGRAENGTPDINALPTRRQK